MWKMIANRAGSYIRKLRSAEPGKRFRGFYDYRRERRSSSAAPSRILTIALAGALVVLGLAIGWLPGPGGFVAILGAALLATEFRALASALDETELRARAAWGWFTTKPLLVQSGVVAGAASVVLGFAGLALYLIQMA